MKITYDSKSFLIDGQRTLILSGEVHYFRLPRAEWKGVLEEAKACGLNAISTYIPWNLHEPKEGKWDFAGDKDLEGFLKLCKQLGLLVIAKPGPYIQAEWNFGGFPSWLHAKGVRHFRVSDAMYMGAVDKYLDKILGLLARHQVGKGGTVFLVQIEDRFDEAPQDPAYLRHLENKFKKKLSLPVYFNLGDSGRGGGFVRGALLGASASDRVGEALRRLRELISGTRQPLMLTQFQVGKPNQWGQPASHAKQRPLEHSLNEALAHGASLINLTPFAGGTNFGEWAGRGVSGDHSFVTTSHDCDAPLSEGGRKTSKALALGLWARQARALEGGLLGSEVVQEDHPVVPSEIRVTARQLGDIRVYFLYNPTQETLNGKIQVDEAIHFTLAPGERRVFSYHVPLTPNLSVRGCSHPWYVQHVGTRAVVVLWGDPGQKLQFFGSGTLDVTERSNESILCEHERKGFQISAEFSNRPQRLLAKVLFEQSKREVLFLIVPRYLAELSSFDAGKGLLVLGSAEVDFGRKSARLDAGSQTLVLASESDVDEHYLTVKPVTPKSFKIAAQGALSEEGLIKRLEARKDWVEAAAGKDLSEYGFTAHRAWYRVTFNASAKGVRKLIFPDLEDQFAVFAAGNLLGLYGRLGKGLDVDVPVKQGENKLYLNVESWGRYGYGTKLGEKKGLILPVFDGGEVAPFGEGWHFLEAAGPLDFHTFSAPTFVGRGWETGALPKALERGGFVCARKKFKVPDWAKRVRLNLHAGDVEIQVALNGQLLGKHPDALGAQYQEFELTPQLIQGENTMALFFKGPTQGYQHCELLFLGPELRCKLEACEGLYGPNEAEALKDKGWSRTGKGRYGFWRATFKAPALKDVESAWLKLIKNGRGVIWLNGQSLGRHFKSGPQNTYKVPLSWFKPNNELLVLEQDAPLPGSAEIELTPLRTEERLP